MKAHSDLIDYGKMISKIRTNIKVGRRCLRQGALSIAYTATRLAEKSISIFSKSVRHKKYYTDLIEVAQNELGDYVNEVKAEDCRRKLAQRRQTA